jgi:RimJ/RimL family protein N-acetyltransferase
MMASPSKFMDRQSSLLGSPFELREGAVILRPFTRRDAQSADYLRWMNDPLVTRTIGRFDYLLPVSRAKLLRYFDDIDTNSTVFLGIHVPRRAAKRSLVGTLKIYDIDALARRASLGIMVGERNVWGRGIASTAIAAACKYVFGVLGFGKVAAGYLASNVAMHKAFRTNGFSVEGVLRRHVFFSGRLDDHVMVGKFRNEKA